MVDQELVSVVIPARNEARNIGPLLDSVLGQTWQNLQVLVVDGCSEDATAEIVSRRALDDPRVELLENPHRFIPMALNLAVDRARGRFLVRVDAHCEIPDDYVERVVAHLSTGEHGGVGGRKTARGRTTTGRAIAAAMGSPFGQGNSVYHYGSESQLVDHIPFGAYPVEVIRDVGGWSETQVVNEDYEFDYRVRSSGRTLLFDPAIEIDWHCRETLRDLFQQYRRYGSGKVQTLRAHPESAALRHLAAPAMVAVLGLAAAMLPWRRLRRSALLLAAPYAAVVLAGTATTLGRLEGGAERARLPLAFMAIHLGWGLGFWEEVLAVVRGTGGVRPGLAASRGY
jgi:glycosyltransferase involved in cell wall biosynthesis